MINRLTILLCVTTLIVSCTSVEAKTRPVLHEIEGFSPRLETTPSATIESIDEASTEDGSGTEITVAYWKPNSFARMHEKAVTDLKIARDGKTYYSASADGFISWYTEEGFVDTWQISDIPVRQIAPHPEGTVIAAYESDGFSIHRVSVWDVVQKKRLYAKRFRDSVTSLSWSARGTYLLVGNTSVEGITTLDGNTGSLKTVFTKSPGIVSFAATGASETNIITYGPSGRIIYTDMLKGTQRAEYAGPTSLMNTVLFANGLSLAGYKDGYIYVAETTTGRTLRTLATTIPVFSAAETDADILWFSKDEEGRIILHEGSEQRIIPDIFSGNDITAVTVNTDHAFIGTSQGAVYSFKRNNPGTQDSPFTAVTAHRITRIDDIHSDGARLFVLSDGALFISSGPGRPPVFAFDRIEGNRVSMHEGELFFWSTTRTAPFVKTSLDGDARTILHEPVDSIRSVQLTGRYASLVEGSRLITVVDIDTSRVAFTYQGAGIQDAVLIHTNKLIVSKSYTTISPFVLQYIHTETGETVPLKADGDLCYGLKMSQTGPTESILHAFLVRKNDTGAQTELIQVTVNHEAAAQAAIKPEAAYGDEDLSAYSAYDGKGLFTTLGKTSVTALYPVNSTPKRFNRASSLPERVVTMDSYMVTLNHDGSITWYQMNSSVPESSAVFTDKRMWMEY